MKLTRLELKGFKSFADTADLPFGVGVTAIVGPNGCGKSNISDAVRWVLGEQRARLLRSARMDEVIFQGSVKRRPINVTDVSLVFDNNDGKLDVPYHEVEITRRLSRSGQSEYLLNQSSVRLRDIQDLLRGTGLGSDAGVVIEAQMIERLLSDKAEERRSLFEEAAGIGLYRDRKESTERRLERTTADLQRLDDLIGEVQTQVRSLARQRGRAERHEKYAAERFQIVMTLTRRDLTGFDTRRSALIEQRDTLRREIPEARVGVQEHERARESRAQERAAAEARRTEMERRLGQTRVELERLEGDLKIAEERLTHATERRARAVEERGEADERATRAAHEVEAAAAEHAAAQAARESVQGELDLRSRSEDEARQKLAQRRQAVRDLEGELQQHAERSRSLAGERSALERDLEDLESQEEAGRTRLDEATRRFDSTVRDADVARETLHECERDEREAGTVLERARHALAAAREHEAAIRIEQREAEERMAQLGARREALADLERKREGLAPAARALLGEGARFGEGAVIGPLSDFVRLPHAKAELAERLLADWLHAVLVRDEETVSAIRQWHHETHPGPLVLLPVDPGPQGATGDPAEDLALSVAPEAGRWVAALLHGAEPFDERGDAVRRANGAVFLSAPGAAGPLSRRAELDELGVSLTEADRRLEQLSRAAAEAAGAYAEAERSHQTAAERLTTTRAALHEAQAASDDAHRHRLRADRERTEAEENLARVSQRVSERRARLKAVHDQLTAVDEQRQRTEEELRSQQASLEELESLQDAARERRVHWQVEEAQVSAREEAAREREARAQTTMDEARALMARLEAELSALDETTSNLDTQLREWRDSLDERRVAVQEMERATKEADAAVHAADEALAADDRARDEARQRLDALTESLHHLELELTELDGRRRALGERVEGEWHRPLETLLADTEEMEGDTDALRQEADRLAAELERIGPVNPLAVKEHAEEVERLDFLTTQRDDLVAARDSLRQALREIEHTAREMFLETFAAVREHFQTVFHTLFEGGECDVRLADESDPLACEIDIHAAPRGKRTQRIHLLSSGERALVAISLLFAIYLAKPAPFCLLDEVDAPLDDANVMRFVRLLDAFKHDTQFIVITHNPRTMQVADAVYGVTMQEPGVSTIVGVRLGEVEHQPA